MDRHGARTRATAHPIPRPRWVLEFAEIQWDFRVVSGDEVRMSTADSVLISGIWRRLLCTWMHTAMWWKQIPFPPRTEIPWTTDHIVRNVSNTLICCYIFEAIPVNVSNSSAIIFSVRTPRRFGLYRHSHVTHTVFCEQYILNRHTIRIVNIEVSNIAYTFKVRCVRLAKKWLRFSYRFGFGFYKIISGFGFSVRFLFALCVV